MSLFEKGSWILSSLVWRSTTWAHGNKAQWRVGRGGGKWPQPGVPVATSTVEKQEASVPPVEGVALGTLWPGMWTLEIALGEETRGSCSVYETIFRVSLPDLQRQPYRCPHGDTSHRHRRSIYCVVSAFKEQGGGGESSVVAVIHL